MIVRKWALDSAPWEYAFSLSQVVWRWNSSGMFAMMYEGLDPISPLRIKYHDLNGGGMIVLICLFYCIFFIVQ